MGEGLTTFPMEFLCDWLGCIFWNWLFIFCPEYDIMLLSMFWGMLLY